jgi:hypothetical protein
MSNFTKWLVDNGHTTSEDAYTIIGELSGPEADILYEQFLKEGNEDN